MISSACLGWPAPVPAQSGVAPTRADYARAEQFLPSRTAPLVRHQVQHATWLPNGNVWYRTSTASGTEFVLLDPRLGSKSPLFDTAKLAAALSKAANTPVDGSHLPLQSLELSADGTSISFEAHSQHWSCELRNDLCAKTAPPDPDASVSPDKTRAVFIRDDNLWVRELHSGAETQLTTDGASTAIAQSSPGRRTRDGSRRSNWINAASARCI
jgi:dipeptidyl-peptidase 4